MWNMMKYDERLWNKIWKIMKHDERWWEIMKDDKLRWKMITNDEKLWKNMKGQEKKPTTGHGKRLADTVLVQVQLISWLFEHSEHLEILNRVLRQNLCGKALHQNLMSWNNFLGLCLCDLLWLSVLQVVPLPEDSSAEAESESCVHASETKGQGMGKAGKALIWGTQDLKQKCSVL